jgi:hypothetical protein
LFLGKPAGKSLGNRLRIYLLTCRVGFLVYGLVDGPMDACLKKLVPRAVSPPQAIIRPNAAIAMSV